MSRTIAMGYRRGGTDTPDVGAVAREAATMRRDRTAFALTIRLDVEALDEQIAREADAAEHDREGW